MKQHVTTEQQAAASSRWFAYSESKLMNVRLLPRAFGSRPNPRRPFPPFSDHVYQSARAATACPCPPPPPLQLLPPWNRAVQPLAPSAVAPGCHGSPPSGTLRVKFRAKIVCMNPRMQLRSPERAAATALYLATCGPEEACAGNGQYFEDGAVAATLGCCCDEEAQVGGWVWGGVVGGVGCCCLGCGICSMGFVVLTLGARVFFVRGSGFRCL